MLRAMIVVGMMMASPAIAQDRLADRKAIVANEEAWGNSFMTGDPAICQRLVADEFSGTTTRGERYDRSTLIGWVHAGPNLSANKTIVTDIRFYGDVALVRGRDEVIGAPPEREARNSIWTDVWVKRDGSWVIVSAQDAREAAK